MNEIDLAELINTPKPGDCPYTLFLGAGASVSSGIPSANAMVRNWQRSIYQSITKGESDENDFGRWLEHEYDQWKEAHLLYPGQTDYSLLFSYRYKQPQERQLYIEKLLEMKKPSFGYLYLGSLVAGKYFNRVITTNFDDLLNDTLRKFYDIKPMVCAFDSAISGIRIASQKPKIVKLHGDFLYSDIRSISRKVNYSFRSLQENMEEKIEEMCKGYGLIVVGYNGNDQSIMSALNNILKSPEYLTYGLHWCLTSNSIPYKLQELKNSYPDTIHFYYIESFDQLMEKIHLACRTDMPKVLTEPHKYSLTKEFYESVRGGSSAKLTSSMKYYLDVFIRRAVNKINTDDYLIMQAELNWELGAEKRSNNKPEEAMDQFFTGYCTLLKITANSVENSIKVLRRKSGLCIGIAKLNKAGIAIPQSQENQENILLEDWESALKLSLEFVDEGIRISQTIEAQTVPLPLRRTFPYNGCCAYSLLSEWSQYFTDINSITETENLIQEKVIDFIENIKSLDLEKTHLQKLSRDSDFQYLLNYSNSIKNLLNSNTKKR
ncbi:SIR2 family protein [Sodalinema gerasimenkoae]|uniref:SIR2 family protein n=1 Tax=Sodalinema gerasimenkoae TaxID=2862348 RepID=UPI0013587855|nr:SIR2 family protein [Sodalinema gerasimenkoae]